MSAGNRPAGLNRALLALCGLVLLAAGAVGLGIGLGPLAPALGLDPTAPLAPPGVGVLPWVPFVAAGASTLLALGFLRWLLAQALRATPTRDWRPPTEGPGTTRLDGAAPARAVAADIASYPGVAGAEAHLLGTWADPVLHVSVTTAPDTAIGPLRERIARHAIPRLCRALERDELPATVLLRLDPTATVTRAR